MPRKYKRKENASVRAIWTEQQLAEAIEKVKSGEISQREAKRRYNVPPRTLMRRMKCGKLNKHGLGPEGVLGRDNEKRLVAHIQRLSASGFAPDRGTVRELAYKFAEKLNLKHKFSAVNEKAGKAWLQSFLERNPELSVRQAEGLSLARAKGMNREDVRKFFDLLERLMTEHGLFDKPSHIFNMDETGVQLINKPGKVITTKGSKDVHVLTAKERGENVTVIACCSADGKFTAPVLIFKGVNRKPEFADGLPAGSKVYMNKKSSFINLDLFRRWLTEIFIPQKPPGKCLLILDGHTSHSTDIDMLQIADSNDIVLLCLPSHCTQALQPLDRSFFRPFKTYFNQEAQCWMKHHTSRNITRYQAGQIIGKAWLRSTSVATAVNGFKATGIYPLDINAIPDHFFSMQDTSDVNLESMETDRVALDTEHITNMSVDSTSTSALPEPEPEIEPQPSTSTSTFNDFSPTKLLHEMSPVPKLPSSFNKRIKQGALVLTSIENIRKHQNTSDNKRRKEQKQIRNSNNNKEYKCTKKTNGPPKSKATVVYINEATWRESDEEPLIELCKRKECYCIECFERYEDTNKKDDWIECLICKKWFHEGCSMYGETCNLCSREELRKKNLN